ncbi:MAG TPA: ATP-binding protein [Candidatus Acidoferrales bacterium]|nr:ATP-binding protein [Candidatus Acidoferrales bacterium]
MIFRRFSVAVFVRTVFICLSAFILVYILTKTNFIATPFIVALLVIAQVYSLIHYAQKTNREIARFFDSIKYSDFSQSFRPTIKGSSFEELDNAFSEVIEEFRKARAEKEEHYRYLQIVVQHVGIGLMAFTQDGNVELMNTAAKRLLKVNGVDNISELSRVSPSLVAVLREIKSGDKVLVKITAENELSQLSIYATEFKLKENHYTLVSLTNIQSELEEREMEAWQNLIRVLTHEIMNSVTPIVSLSSTASALLNTAITPETKNDREPDRGALQGPGQLDGENLRDVKGALDTISKRSEGLLHFVDDYRNLTRIPTPNFQTIKLMDLFGRIDRLFADRFHLRKIWYTCSADPPDLELTADPDLIEQVLINMVLNSISALSSTASPMIKLFGKIDSHGGTIIQVIDNGHGIPEELQEKIFIPFFTTRKEGSGIGLSLARQIMRAHKGGITVHSIQDKETVFTLRF